MGNGRKTRREGRTEGDWNHGKKEDVKAARKRLRRADDKRETEKASERDS